MLHINGRIYLTVSLLRIFESVHRVLSFSIIYYLLFGECFIGSVHPGPQLRLVFRLYLRFFSILYL
jgi:hypothetical protein